MIIFTIRCQQMKLIINGKYVAKKIKILSKTYVMYLKRKLRTRRNQIQVEKV